MVLTVGSLFSGIGGIDLGLERAGMESRWFVEWDAHCQNILRRHWPGLPVYGDITTVDWSTVEPVDVLAGGFPCQPVSSAGLRRAQADDRWLWPEFSRAIRALRPRYVFVENVRDLLAVNGGSAMAEVLEGLASIGYDAEWDCIPASAVGAPHQRDRLWIVAYPTWVQPRRQEQRTERQRTGLGREPITLAYSPSNGRCEGRSKSTRKQGRPGSSVGRTPMADTYRGRQQERAELDGDPTQDATDGGSRRAHPNGRRVFVGTPSRDWLPEPDVGRVADGVPHRVDRLRSLGNAVVPQVVEWIGRRIVAFDAGEAVAA